MTNNPVIMQKGKCSWFGGPLDGGMKEDEGLALISGPLALQSFYRHLFIAGLDASKGLGRQLNPLQFYCAMRWDYEIWSAQVIRRAIVKVTGPTGLVVWCTPVDWGPNAGTDRVIDMSISAMTSAGAETDSIVTAELYL